MTPKVSVHIVTYNHARFIRQTLDSVLTQDFDAPLEICIGDDASTDGTAEILREYSLRYPDRVRAVLRERNMGPGPNAVDILNKCTGEYIAFLEGDDYWTTSNKLKLQAEYLDRNPGCSLVHHAVEHIAWPSGAILGKAPAPLFRFQRPDPKLLSMTNYIQTCSVMFRRSALPKLDEGYLALRIGDWPLFVLLAQNGWVGYIDKVMAHYRIHSANSWNNRAPDYKLRAMESMANYLLGRVDEHSKRYWRSTLLALAFKDLGLAVQSLSAPNAMQKLFRFIKLSFEFKQPFWVVTSLWPYYRANVRRGFA
ncbi:MAG TPA: glycosyltransferase [Verrucomicrobiae bacterium]|nr:glycosyltransferase [Verrucomicrobiae bacterium]